MVGGARDVDGDGGGVSAGLVHKEAAAGLDALDAVSRARDADAAPRDGHQAVALDSLDVFGGSEIHRDGAATEEKLSVLLVAQVGRGLAVDAVAAAVLYGDGTAALVVVLPYVHAVADGSEDVDGTETFSQFGIFVGG